MAVTYRNYINPLGGPLTGAMPLAEVTAIGLVPQRIAAAVAGSLGLVGLLLAAGGSPQRMRRPLG